MIVGDLGAPLAARVAHSVVAIGIHGVMEVLSSSMTLQLSFAREKSGERTVRRGGAIAAR